jgi:hypothetical protein
MNKHEIVQTIAVPIEPRWVRKYDICTDTLLDGEGYEIELVIVEGKVDHPFAFKLAENLYLAADLKVKTAQAVNG